MPILRLFALMLLVFKSSCLLASDIPVEVSLYLSSTCPHCHKADDYFKTLEKQLPWISVKRFIIDKDMDALKSFQQALKHSNQQDFAVPSIFFCDTRFVGFADNHTSGARIKQALLYCQQQLKKHGRLLKEDIAVLKHMAYTSGVDVTLSQDVSALTITLTAAFLDMISPCSLFFLLSLFSFLFIQKDMNIRFSVLLIAMILLVVNHLWQQFSINSWFEINAWLRWPAMMVGIGSLVSLKLYLKQPVKPLFFIMWSLIVLTLVLFLQQSCLLNWALIFRQSINEQSLSQLTLGSLQMIYELFYLIPLIVMAIIIRLPKLNQTPASRYLFHTGLMYIFLTSLTLIFYPQGFSSMAWSFYAFILSGLWALALIQWSFTKKG